MKLKIQPIWGHGWSDASQAFEVPAAFDLEIVAALRDSSSGRLLTALGQLHQTKHQLDGLWVLLTARHLEDSGHYNLEAFTEKPDLREPWIRASLVPPKIAGFVRIEERST